MKGNWRSVKIEMSKGSVSALKYFLFLSLVKILRVMCLKMGDDDNMENNEQFEVEVNKIRADKKSDLNHEVEVPI